LSDVTVDANTSIPDARGIRALWTALLLPPTAFLVSLEIAYALVPAACASGNTLPLHLAHLGCLLVILGAGLTAWRCWKALGSEWPDDAGTPEARSRFLAGVAVLLSGTCVLVVLTEWIAVFLLDPCQ
jgi:hypothetical protein